MVPKGLRRCEIRAGTLEPQASATPLLAVAFFLLLAAFITPAMQPGQSYWGRRTDVGGRIAAYARAVLLLFSSDTLGRGFLPPCLTFAEPVVPRGDHADWFGLEGHWSDIC